MENYMKKKYLIGKQWFANLSKEENGETNIVAIILIIIIVIGLVVLFKDRISAIVGNLFDKIDSRTDTF